MRYIPLIIGLALAGCQTVQEQIAQDDARCRSYGVQPGSEHYVACRANLDRGRADVKASERFASGGGLMTTIQRASGQ